MALIVNRPAPGSLHVPRDAPTLKSSIDAEIEEFCDICDDASPIEANVVLRLHKKKYPIVVRNGLTRAFDLKCGVRISCEIKTHRDDVLVENFKREAAKVP